MEDVTKFSLSNRTEVTVDQTENGTYVFTLIRRDGSGNSFTWRKDIDEKTTNDLEIDPEMHEALHTFWRILG